MDKETIKSILLAHGFTIKPGETDLRPYVYNGGWAIYEAALKAAQPKWQPIETAPDNTPVLVYWPDPMGDIAEVMAKMEGEWTGTMTLINPHVNPTHWQPLPAPPEVPE